MHLAFGIVVHASTQLPLRHLYVTAYLAGSDQKDESDWTRLASDITDSRGVFRLEYEFAAAANRRAVSRLVIAVDAVSPSGETQTRLAIETRRNPAQTERFRLRISEENLRAVDDDPAVGVQDVDARLRNRDRQQEQRAKFQEESDGRLAKAISQQARSEVEQSRESDRLLEVLARTESLAEVTASGRVGVRGSVRARNLEVIKSGIESTVNPSRLKGRLGMDAAMLKAVKDDQGSFPGSIPAETLLAILQPGGPTDILDLYSGPDLSGLCREDVPPDPCLALLEETSSEPSPVTTPVENDATDQADEATPDNPLTDERIAVLLNNLLEGLSAGIPNIGHRISASGVSEGIQDFALKGGPADMPSVHEFHNLSIAFDHVWNEVLSNRLTELAKELTKKIADGGLKFDDVFGDASSPEDIKFRLPSLKESAKQSQTATPPFEVVKVFDIADREWYEAERLGFAPQLESLANDYLAGPIVEKIKVSGKSLKDLVNAMNDYMRAVREAKDTHEDLKKQGESVIAYLRRSVFERPRFQKFHQILEDLEQEVRGKYRFPIFGAANNERAVNFGLLSTYQQTWTPVAYQVGELVRSVPLAPKEVRKFSKKVTIRHKRSEKEVRKNISSLKTDQADTKRAESEILEKAKNDSNFKMSAEAGFNIGVASASTSLAFAHSAGSTSQELKKQFRESVVKAAQEVRDEQKLEIDLSTEEEVFAEDSGEIRNPNDEISVTYLFFQLQRRFRLSERLHRVRPVVLVAQDVPSPSEIDDDWLISHDWILRRVLLDDSFLPALDYLSTAVVGDELSLQELFQNVEQQRKIAEALKQEFVKQEESEKQQHRALQRAIERFAEDSGDEELQILRGAAQDLYDRAVRRMRDVESRLQTEISTLNSLTASYSEALSAHLNRRAQIARLTVHVKDNIMYYMQAIWAHEPPDQRFLRLKDVPVPVLNGELTYTLQSIEDADPVPPDWEKPTELVADCKLEFPKDYEPLSKVADIDGLLGFKGNYVILPLRKRNVLTDYMMTPFLDAHGLRDPAPAASWNLQDFGKYVCCLHKELSDDDFSALRPGLIEAYRQILASPYSENEEIVVPTDSLFIEALPGAHSVLENFKLRHRIMDVRKVQSEIRGEELENLRAAARILGGELDDPDIDKLISVHGTADIPPDSTN